jgi:integrase
VFLDRPNDAAQATLDQRWQALSQLIDHGTDQGLLIVVDDASGRPDEVCRLAERLCTLFGLLAATGLRISEALNLQTDDVTRDGLLVRNTKFGKSRLLPLHATTQERLESYLVRRRREAGACPFVFVSGSGGKLHPNTVRGVFRRLVYALGVAKATDKLRPRLHDLRFYFANQALTQSPCDHDGIGRHMVALTTYLGHRDVRNGYWYLEATPALFAKIAARCENFALGGQS